MPADPLAATARELAALPAADRRAILQAFVGDDRARLRAALRDDPPPSASMPVGSHSRWFEGLLQDDAPPTAAARAALRDAAGQDRVGPPGRSLLQVAGGLLAPARAR